MGITVIEIVGRDLFSFVDADVIFITTNGLVKDNGEAIMGRGCALQALRLGGTALAKHFGSQLQQNGNIPIPLGNLVSGKIQVPVDFSKKAIICSFPTKHNWYNRSDIELIKYSAYFAVMMANETGWQKLILPRPGCSNGGLEWSFVKEVLEPILDDRFVVVHKEI